MALRRASEVCRVQFYLRGATDLVQRWALEHGVPGWIVELPGGWTMLRTVTVDGAVLGTSLTGEAALLEWSGLAADVCLVELDQLGLDELHTVADGQVTQRPLDRAEKPWEADDDRSWRGLAAAPGDRRYDIASVATRRGAPATGLYVDGWTLFPHLELAPVTELVSVDPGSAIGLLVQGDELHLWLATSGHVVAQWSWGAPDGFAVALDQLPPAELSSEALSKIAPLRPDISAFDDSKLPVQSLDDLDAVLAATGTADEIVPRLLAALGLPSAACDHLLGVRFLPDDPDAVRVEPKPIAVAIMGSMVGASRTEASARSPSRRLWGAILGAAYLLIFTGLVVERLSRLDSDPPDGWGWVYLGVRIASFPIAVMPIINWLKLRGTGHASPAEPAAPPTPSVRSRRRNPTAVLCWVLALGFAALCGVRWVAVEPMRVGVTTTATVISVGDRSSLVEFDLPDGQTVTAEPQDTDWRPGDVVEVSYDPLNPAGARSATWVWDDAPFQGIGVMAGFLLVLGALFWWRVIRSDPITVWLE